MISLCLVKYSESPTEIFLRFSATSGPFLRRIAKNRVGGASRCFRISAGVTLRWRYKSPDSPKRQRFSMEQPPPSAVWVWTADGGNSFRSGPGLSLENNPPRVRTCAPLFSPHFPVRPRLMPSPFAGGCARGGMPRPFPLLKSTMVPASGAFRW